MEKKWVVVSFKRADVLFEGNMEKCFNFVKNYEDLEVLSPRAYKIRLQKVLRREPGEDY